MAATRAAMGQVLGGPTASKSVSPAVVPAGGELRYTLQYTHSGADATLVMTDVVPAATTVITAAGPGTVTVDGQTVNWQVAVSSGEVPTLTIDATTGSAFGPVSNSAVFSSTVQLQREASLLIYQSQVFLPLIQKQ